MNKSKAGTNKNLYFSEKIKRSMLKILNYPLTIVEAPMGYGKTTAVSNQLSFYNVNVMLQRVYDNSLTNFWSGFCHLFSQFDEERFKSLLELEFPYDSVSESAALNILKSIELPEGSVIVIDDYHLVECDEANSFIEYIVISEMLNFNIVLNTRFTFFPRLEELKLKEYLYHVKKEDFELNPEDIISYYGQSGVSIKRNEAEKLYAFTEGWISALHLIKLNYGSSHSFSHSQDIYMLIDKAVYSPLSEAGKDLLVNMSVFDDFTLGQAKYVWKGDNPEEYIDLLVEKNDFVAYDYNKKTYHIHSILKKFLEEKLENKEKTYKEALYIKAAKWYMEKEQYLYSMRYAYLAGEFGILLKTVELDKGHSINSEYKNLIIKYFEECPSESKKKFPFAMLVYARRMFTFNEVILFKKACAEFMENIEDMEFLDKEYKDRLLGEYELLLSFTGYNDIEKMSQHHKRACQLLTSASSLLGVKASWTFGSPSVLYMFHRSSGELEKEIQIIRKAMPFYYQITKNHGNGAEYVMEAEGYYYTGDFENSEIVMHRAFQEANDASQSGIIICCVFLQIRLAFIKGDFSTILDLIRKAREDINSKKWYLFMHTLDMCEAYIYSYLNIKQSIPQWIREGDFKNTRLFFPTMGFLNIVYGRSMLISGEYLKLIGSSQKFIAIASVFPNLLAQIYTFIYLAAANNRIFRQEQALDELKKALEIAMPDKIYMPFVENCDYIKSLLEELYRQGSYKEDIEKILNLYKPYEEAIKQIIEKNFTENKLVLTKREMQIARLAVEGLSNKEIGEKLLISQNTVKTQLKRVFEKLGINSRVLLKQYLS